MHMDDDCLIERTQRYMFIKLYIYKPIRKFFEGFRYGYHFSDELMVESRKQFIRRVKYETMERE